MKESKILKWIIILPIIAVTLTAFILTHLFLTSITDKHETEIQSLKEKHLSNLKNTIQERIEHLSIILENSYNQQLIKSQQDVKNIVELGHTMIENIYNQHPNLPREAYFKLINENMKNIRFFENNSGYYFIYDLKDGISISLPSAPQLVGTSLMNLTDKKGKRLFDSYGHILDKYGQGFDHWYWNKPGEKEFKEKVGYIKKFSPLNIAIGTAVYTEDIKENISKNGVKSIKKLKFSDESYIFVMDNKGTALHHAKKDIINVPIEKLDVMVQNNVTNIIKNAVMSDGTFIEYTQSKKLFEQTSAKKISYVKYIQPLNWIIGTGLYTNALNEEIEQKEAQLKQQLKNDIKSIVVISLGVTLIIIFLLLLLSKKINSRFNFYSKKLQESNHQLTLLNSELEAKVEKQVQHLRQKDLMLNQQSKLSAMGEMLGNISHQWRQPLSAISTLASGIIIQKEMGMLKDQQMDEDLQNIVHSTQLLSNTIDDFRNFYSTNKQISTFKVQEAIDKVLNLVSANIKNNDIEVILDIKELNLSCYKNELIQVLLNLINNGKDALKEVESQRYLFINAYKQDGNIIIEILDNANGIESSNMHKIFEPYFTTKGEQKGTGIGLYMSKNILENSLFGRIKVKNKTYTYNSHSYTGASFKVILPIQPD